MEGVGERITTLTALCPEECLFAGAWLSAGLAWTYTHSQAVCTHTATTGNCCCVAPSIAASNPEGISALPALLPGGARGTLAVGSSRCPVSSRCSNMLPMCNPLNRSLVVAKHLRLTAVIHHQGSSSMGGSPIQIWIPLIKPVC